MPFKFSDSRRGDREGGRHFEGKDGGEHPRKLFVGGLSYETTKEDLEKHFGEYGEIVDCVVMVFPDSHRSRGFGFVTFDDVTSVDAVQEARPHIIDGRDVETKRATPRGTTSRDSQQSVKKMFIGGIPEESTEEDVRAGCEEYGSIAEVNILKHHDTGRSRGFCFVTFEDYDSVDKVCMKGYVEVLGKKVEVKKATPKGGDQRDRGGRGGRDRFGGGGDRGRDRYNSYDRGFDRDRGDRYDARSRSPVRGDRYSGRSGSHGTSIFSGSSNYSQSAPSGGDVISNLGNIAPALASLSALAGLLSNNAPAASSTGGSNALTQLVAALGASSGGGSGALSSGGQGSSYDPSGGRVESYTDRGSGQYAGQGANYGSSTGYSSNYSTGYSSSYSTGMTGQEKDYRR